MKETSLTRMISLFCVVLLFSCKQNQEKESSTELNTNLSLSEEKLYRPFYHFTPKKGWMNDPNGMFFYNGYYHLYFQHYPDDNVWGPMHWGHAISTDLLTWREQPIALHPDELGYIFSGSAVVDEHNTSGFGKDGIPPIVAIFTYHDPIKAKEGKTDAQTQGIAYSLDEGLTFIKYEGNPVINNPGINDFRDPKVSWHEDDKKWVMVLAAHDRLKYYESKDLKKWKFLSDFGEDIDKKIGAHGGVWECPDLIKLPVEGTNEFKWVQFVSINPGGPNGGSSTQYFVGDFDGKTFTMDKEFELALQKRHNFWLDFGRDNYAGVTWSNIETKDKGKLFIGWMSNWDYANQVPTETWRSAMTIPRELKLVKDSLTHRISFAPIQKLSEFSGKKYAKEDIIIRGEQKLIDSEQIDLTRAEIHFTIANPLKNKYTFKLSNQNNEELLFGYDHVLKKFFLDRKKAGKTDFSEKFSGSISVAPRIGSFKNLSGTILLDKTSIEIFYDDGLTVMTGIFFLTSPFKTLSISSNTEVFELEHIEINELNFN